MKRYFADLFGGFYSLLVGMQITIKRFFQPSVTVRYPRETVKIPDKFRGHIELTGDPDTGKPYCWSCQLCVKACPSYCITVDGVKPEGERRKVVTTFIMDFTKCSLCGACIEACRDEAIQYSKEYNLASLNKDDYVMELFDRYNDQLREGKIKKIK